MPSPEGTDRHRAVIPPIRPMPARNSLNNYIISHKFCCIDKPTQKTREKLTSEAPDFFFFHLKQLEMDNFRYASAY